MAVVEMQPVGAGRQWWPVLLERGGKVGEFRPGLLGDCEIGDGERVFFDGDEMQPAAALRVGRARPARWREN